MQGISEPEFRSALNTIKAKHPTANYKFFRPVEAAAKVLFTTGNGYKKITKPELDALLEELRGVLPEHEQYLLPYLGEELEKAAAGHYGGSLLN